MHAVDAAAQTLPERTAETTILKPRVAAGIERERSAR